ncbi:hypothetical protein ACN38_g1632 [Penicillium nordicum]|uniref:Uncharacterized protein n=1 Tax=Penicillium nordicum TaxID=229535 RepID=A0A0M8PBD7_9EURO|nr:hypothetical protein ACN38_g1632 [Penicillium nordicum]
MRVTSMYEDNPARYPSLMKINEKSSLSLSERAKVHNLVEMELRKHGLAVSHEEGKKRRKGEKAIIHGGSSYHIS